MVPYASTFANLHPKNTQILSYLLMHVIHVVYDA